jgi:hypothetical protein
MKPADTLRAFSLPISSTFFFPISQRYTTDHCIISPWISPSEEEGIQADKARGKRNFVPVGLFVYFLHPKLTLVVSMHTTSLTLFVENTYNIYIFK